MGPVRWNLSKSGIGMSVGIRGLRVGTGPRGAYIAGGRGGLYFRQSLGGKQRAGSPPTAPVPPPGWIPTSQIPAPVPPQVAPIEYLPETQILSSTPASTHDLAQYISAQRSHLPILGWVIAFMVMANLVILSIFWPVLVLAIPLGIVGIVYTQAWDRERTHVLLNYELDQMESQSFGGLTHGLAALAACGRLERIESRQMHGDWKRHAGAMTNVGLSPVAIMPPGSISWLTTNLPVWCIRWRAGNLALIFLPDRLLIEQGRRVASVPYREIQVTIGLGRFVESRPLAPDARVINYTWQFVNKDGGPDRRFRYNRQMPVVEVAYIGLQSQSGVNLLIQASNRQNAEMFVQHLKAFRPLICAEPVVQ